MAAHPEIRGLLDQGPLEGHPQGAVDQVARGQRDEGVPAEQAGAYGCPIGDAGRVGQVDLVRRADLVPVAVERLAPYQTARIDVALHGPSKGVAIRRNGVTPTKVQNP